MQESSYTQPTAAHTVKQSIDDLMECLEELDRQAGPLLRANLRREKFFASIGCRVKFEFGGCTVAADDWPRFANFMLTRAASKHGQRLRRQIARS